MFLAHGNHSDRQQINHTDRDRVEERDHLAQKDGGEVDRVDLAVEQEGHPGQVEEAAISELLMLSHPTLAVDLGVINLDLNPGYLFQEAWKAHLYPEVRTSLAQKRNEASITTERPQQHGRAAASLDSHAMRTCSQV